jgi:hypothetical protein
MERCALNSEVPRMLKGGSRMKMLMSMLERQTMTLAAATALTCVAGCGSPAASPVAPTSAAASPQDHPAPAKAPDAATSAPMAADAPSSEDPLAGLEGYQLDDAKACLGSSPNASKCGSCTRDAAASAAWGRSFACAKAGCALKDAETCRYVAQLTITGRGTPENVEAGLRSWDDQCVNQRSLRDCEALALVYRGGTGTSDELLREVYKRVKPDDEKEKFYLGKQCDLGWEGACASIGRKPPKK